MASVLVLGDINLKNVSNAHEPFAVVGETLRAADVVLANLECCLFMPSEGQYGEDKAFHADPTVGKEALKLAGVSAVGIANNVNFGTAAILTSIKSLDAIDIRHTGAGINADAAYSPVVIESKGTRIGFFQRSTLFWPTGHAATSKLPGIAVLVAHTAYQVPLYGNALGDGQKPMNRPGIPPDVITWADPRHLDRLRADIASLRQTSDYVVVSIHWGLDREVLTYMEQIGRAAVDAGADLVFGHGPHHSLPIEVYRGKPIFYGVGSFSFHIGHSGKSHGAWVGMMIKLDVVGWIARNVRVQFVRNNARNETVACSLTEAEEAVGRVIKSSAVYGTRLAPRGDDLVIEGLS